MAAAAKRPRAGASLSEEHGRRSLRRLEKIKFLGRGQFGSVEEYAVRAARAPARVAMKQAFGNGQSGAELGSVKELTALAELSGCSGVVRLVDAVPAAGGQVWLGLERCVGDLQDVINDPDVVLSEADVKSLAWSLLSALCQIHERGWMHRDLKPENVLLALQSHGAAIRLADFGHACRLPRKGQRMGHEFATVWYRSPELMLHAPTHDDKVDVWAAGCIIAELFLRRPLFPGEPGGAIAARDEEEGTLAQVFRLMGTPDETVWRGCSLLPGWRKFEHREPQRMTDILEGTAASPVACDLLSGLLCLDPAKRLTAREALGHRFFAMDPRATEPGRVPVPAKIRRSAAEILLAERRRVHVAPAKHSGDA